MILHAEHWDPLERLNLVKLIPASGGGRKYDALAEVRRPEEFLLRDVSFQP